MERAIGVARIFFVLACFATLLLISNLGIGLWVGDLNGDAAAVKEASQVYTRARIKQDEQAIEEAEAALRVAADNHQPTKKRHSLHFLLGVFTAVVCVLVNAISVTYFIGTTKWCNEVVDAYSLDPEFAHKSTRLKKSTFPWSLMGILTIIMIVAFGGASDPATEISSTADWVSVHFILSILGTMFLVFSFLQQVGKIGAHYDIIQEIVAATEKRKQELRQVEV
ncbi:MAG: hypothetical protein CMJ76_07580 [Planctomycetaceae bacterium]|nr:hypothetical protein [Planctomycetaceae bacterium]